MNPEIRESRGRRSRHCLTGMILAAMALAASAATACAQDQKKIDAGEQIYNDYCFTCHGEKLVSSGQTFDLRRLTVADRARFENSVLAGKKPDAAVAGRYLQRADRTAVAIRPRQCERQIVNDKQFVGNRQGGVAARL